MKSLLHILVVVCSVMMASSSSVQAATVRLFTATKVTGYTQTTAAGNFISSNSFISSTFTFTSSVTGTTAVFSGPGVTRNLAANSSTSMTFQTIYATGTALEAAFPAGSYSVVLGGTSTGTFTFSFPTIGPAPVRITNYAALQGFNGTSATIEWEPLPIPLNAAESVFFQIYTDDDQHVWTSDNLNASSRSTLVTGLPGNKVLHGYLSYIPLQQATIGGVPGFVERGTLIHFTFSTRTPPVFSAHPLSQAINGRASVPLSATVQDATGVTYQWNKDGAPILGATSSTYNATSSGFYTVTATGVGGSATSNAAILNSTPPAGDSRLYALSCRAKVGIGGNILIPGIAISGTGSRQVVVRAGGPAIQGVDGKLARPQLQLYKVGVATPIASNTGWDTGTPAQDAELRAAFTAANLPQYPDGSADCALLATVEAGAAYTATISGVGDTTGVALVEVYEIGSGTARMSALSCRAQVGTGGDILIPGIIVLGTSPKQLIIRAKGPGIQGVADVLAQPTLTVYSGSGVKLSQNTGWSTSPDATAIAAATAAVGLSPFTPGSGDCAVLLTLPPGGYTAWVSGVNDTTGVALIEVYEVP
jgi:hypothetical protein